MSERGNPFGGGITAHVPIPVTVSPTREDSISIGGRWDYVCKHEEAVETARELGDAGGGVAEIYVADIVGGAFPGLTVGEYKPYYFRFANGADGYNVQQIRRRLSGWWMPRWWQMRSLCDEIEHAR